MLRGAAVFWRDSQKPGTSFHTQSFGPKEGRASGRLPRAPGPLQEGERAGKGTSKDPHWDEASGPRDRCWALPAPPNLLTALFCATLCPAPSLGSAAQVQQTTEVPRGGCVLVSVGALCVCTHMCKLSCVSHAMCVCELTCVSRALCVCARVCVQAHVCVACPVYACLCHAPCVCVSLCVCVCMCVCKLVCHTPCVCLSVCVCAHVCELTCVSRAASCLHPVRASGEGQGPGTLGLPPWCVLPCRPQGCPSSPPPALTPACASRCGRVQHEQRQLRPGLCQHQGRLRMRLPPREAPALEPQGLRG